MAGFKAQAPAGRDQRERPETEWRRRSLLRVRRPAWSPPPERPKRTTQNDIAW